jgi:hypothetical protein
MLKDTYKSCLQYRATKICNRFEQKKMKNYNVHTLFILGQLETLEFASTHGCLTAGWTVILGLSCGNCGGRFL